MERSFPIGVGTRVSRTLTNRPRESDDLDTARARATERGCARIRSRTRRVYVVHEHTVRGASPIATMLPRTFRRRSASASRAAAEASACASGIDRLHVPDAGKRDRERARRDITALPGTLLVAGYVGERLRIGRPDDFGYECGGFAREPAPATLLPFPDERPRSRRRRARTVLARTRASSPSIRHIAGPAKGPAIRSARARVEQGASTRRAMARVAQRSTDASRSHRRSGRTRSSTRPCATRQPRLRDDFVSNLWRRYELAQRRPELARDHRAS